MQIQVLRSRLAGPRPRPPPGEKEIRGAGEGRKLGDSFVKGISIQAAKYQENNFKKRFIVS